MLNLFHLFVLKNRYWYGNNGWGFQPQYYQPVQNEDTKEDKDSTTQKPAKESEFVSFIPPNYVLPTYLLTYYNIFFPFPFSFDTQNRI